MKPGGHQTRASTPPPGLPHKPWAGEGRWSASRRNYLSNPGSAPAPALRLSNLSSVARSSLLHGRPGGRRGVDSRARPLPRGFPRLSRSSAAASRGFQRACRRQATRGEGPGGPSEKMDPEELRPPGSPDPHALGLTSAAALLFSSSQRFWTHSPLSRATVGRGGEIGGARPSHSYRRADEAEQQQQRVQVRDFVPSEPAGCRNSSSSRCRPQEALQPQFRYLKRERDQL